LREIVESEGLNAVTIKCFDLLKYKVTACLALSILNDENIIAACEGDLEALFSMMVGYYLTDKPQWMANPSKISFEENSLTLAHCTIPTRFLIANSIKLNSHMESELSVAIEGILNEEEVTVFRFSVGKKQIMAIEGTIQRIKAHNLNLCRTQTTIVFEGDLKKWMKNSLGNHQVLCYGRIAKKLRKFAYFAGYDFIEI